MPGLRGGGGSSAASALYSTKVIGAYYTTQAPSLGWTTAAGDAALNDLMCFPVVLAAGTLDRLAQQHFASPTASELARLGLYADSSGKPGALVVDAGTIDLSTAAAVKTKTISVTVSTPAL